MSRVLLGVDTGGTFTDFVCFDGSALRIHKVLSTPAAPEQAILQGIRELGLQKRPFYLIHGSTVATNAVLERKGVRVAYVTNYGLGDVLSIGRQARRDLYELQPRPLPPPVPAELCIETGGRLAADGQVVEPLTEGECAQVLQRIEALAPQAVAVNLLFSFIDDGFERRIEALLPDKLFVSRSSDVLPEYREYERGIATWLNAWVGPLVEGYVARLQAAVSPAPVSVMQSSGQTISAGQAARRAVRLLLSGPAGGLTGVRRVARELGIARLLSFDMGGTSTDVALIDGSVSLTSEGSIGGYPVAVPMVDMHTIGAGGGSIARVDEGGMLHVGPESAGADPGPACYGRGGRRATVTDAHLVLGRLRPGAFLGGDMQLDEHAAHAALADLAGSLGTDVEQAAEGVIRLANEHMVQALRVISVQRGVDPRDFVLSAFGGAGGLHVCALAEALGMRRALVPIHAGVLSALGMLAAPRGRQLSHTVRALLAQQRDEELAERLRQLAAEGCAALQIEGVDAGQITREASMDLRYLGQSYTLNVPYHSVAQAIDAFHRLHERRFGHRLEADVELVNLRVGLYAAEPELVLTTEGGGCAAEPIERAALAGVADAVPVWRRQDLPADRPLQGPALIIDRVATSYIAPAWRAVRHVSGSLVLERVKA